MNNNNTNNLSYNERLAELSALSLENMKFYIEMTTVYKFLRGLVNFQAYDFGLHIAASSATGAGVHLAQRRASNCVCANLFPIRAAKA